MAVKFTDGSPSVSTVTLLLLGNQIYVEALKIYLPNVLGFVATYYLTPRCLIVESISEIEHVFLVALCLIIF